MTKELIEEMILTKSEIERVRAKWGILECNKWTPTDPVTVEYRFLDKLMTYAICLAALKAYRWETK